MASQLRQLTRTGPSKLPRLCSISSSRAVMQGRVVQALQVGGAGRGEGPWTANTAAARSENHGPCSGCTQRPTGEASPTPASVANREMATASGGGANEYRTA